MCGCAMFCSIGQVPAAYVKAAVQQSRLASTKPQQDPFVEQNASDDTAAHSKIEFVLVEWDFVPHEAGQLHVVKGETVEVVDRPNAEWVRVKRGDEDGYVRTVPAHVS